MASKAAAKAIVCFLFYFRYFVLFIETGLCPYILQPRSLKGLVVTYLFFFLLQIITPTRHPIETISSLQTFRKRNADALAQNASLKSQPTTVDLAHYRSILRNQAVVEEAGKLLSSLKPVTYDVDAHVKAIEAFEVKAVAKAEETTVRINEELKELQDTLGNIEQARSFDELTVEDVGEAHPELRQAVETMMKKGKWTVPGQSPPSPISTVSYIIFFRLQGKVRRFGSCIDIIDQTITRERKKNSIFLWLLACTKSRVLYAYERKSGGLAKYNACCDHLPLSLFEYRR